ncbi:hypothetical protein CN327_26130 [Bacillus cereus]|uniref:MerR family transcriptional regulator n=1 Tax=Bacillus nitratireducens TaxID=2026193 RepID=UPI000BF8D501|nr:hypothetical protein CN509_23485 [Bacillus cereus]PET05846.1 hypothetical protein CN505_11880 [Bacillus cereus]PFF29070.1 hypothetical protein CN327_26130 [Bacillus cereus]PFH78971.1 hypothetical protein COI81_31045 [Bacillus cereus]PFI50245.1 hypothetical protein COI73_07400 [Bacillus cereus]
MQTYYTIGEAAKMAGTTVKTVRYYSDIGLLQPVSIKESGYRLYSPKEIWQLNMITTLRSLDFSLTDIAKLQEGEVPVHQAIQWQLEAVRHQKILYEKMEQTLEIASHIEDPEESLTFMQKIVEVMKQSAETRKEYLMQKVREKLDEQIVPPDWFQLLFSNIHQSVGTLEDISTEQAVIWHKIKELWDAPEFVTEFQEHLSPFTEKLNNTKIQSNYYYQVLNQILLEVIYCLESNVAYTDAKMQSLVITLLQTLANMLQTKYSTKFVQNMYPTIQYFTSKRGKQFYALLSEFNPDSKIYQEAWNHIYNGYFWMLKHEKFVFITEEE